MPALVTVVIHHHPHRRNVVQRLKEPRIRTRISTKTLRAQKIHRHKPTHNQEHHPNLPRRHRCPKIIHDQLAAVPMNLPHRFQPHRPINPPRLQRRLHRQPLESGPHKHVHPKHKRNPHQQPRTKRLRTHPNPSHKDRARILQRHHMTRPPTKEPTKERRHQDRNKKENRPRIHHPNL